MTTFVESKTKIVHFSCVTKFRTHNSTEYITVLDIFLNFYLSILPHVYISCDYLDVFSVQTFAGKPHTCMVSHQCVPVSVVPDYYEMQTCDYMSGRHKNAEYLKKKNAQFETNVSNCKSYLQR